ncbi:NAD(P)-dependent oxidoreductase [Sulfurospirillum arcachonense]|uniref:NAD(P)-dependent oxidoreductase n=1 Tax=Sulfurospirillum arcachonense TaxID=57666 RepID=UPI0004694BFD|nr:NAD(P)-dependent oxidoreductase [Sulfurospirillum arcachonense]
MNKYTIDLANTCLGCKKPSCEKGCPVNTPIAEMIRLFLSGEIRTAGQMLFDNNPLSIICSLVCPHEKHCEGHCVLNKKKTAVSVGSIENYISDFYMHDTQFKKPEHNGHNIAIIGSGPAGIALAFILASKGYGITMYDSHDKIGGVLRQGIPDFRLNKNILDKLIEKLKQLGVIIRPNIMIGKNITIDDLFRDGFKAVFLSTGVWSPKKLGIKGESLGHVHFAIDYLKNPSVYDLGKKVVVLGAGNVAMDVARTAVRNGVKEVVIMYRKGEENIPAEKHEVDCAKIDGVKFDFYKEPLEFNDKGIFYQTTDGTDEKGFIETDSIFISISQNPNDIIVKNNKDISVDEKGLLSTDENGMTSRVGVFASGDVVTGARTVVEAVAFSKKVAVSIEEYIDNL